MATNKHKTTFWEFLRNYSIEIPIIQRDYAQGRDGKESLRKNFLCDLKGALDNKEEMKLDFVYGSTENDKLYPLDGQQRLTTLWLLHWYIALKAGKLKEASTRLKNFSYETRVSSRNFCEELCDPEHFEKYDCSLAIVEFIANQTWFYSTWKQDPTIQSMLRMLGGSKNNNMADGIEKVFGCANCIINRENRFNNYYNSLIGLDCPIVFYYLPKDFGNSDDLYIKMNARGEQLTNFENFKADMIGYITKQSENGNLEAASREEWKELLDPEKGILKKLDTDWTDIFWKNKSIGTSNGRMVNHIDEIYFAFLNRFFWNELFIGKENNKFILEIGKGIDGSNKENSHPSYKYLNGSDNPNDGDSKIAYIGIDLYKYFEEGIPLVFFQKLRRVLDNLKVYLNNYSNLPECAWNKEFHFIPQYIIKGNGNVAIKNDSSEDILKVTTLNQIQRIVFFAICKYFDHNEKVTDDEYSLKHWMRVVWNLVSGEDNTGYIIRSTQAMRSAIEFINSLDSHDVYHSLNNKLPNSKIFSPKEYPGLGDLSNTDFGKKCKEEIAKAHQIIINNPRADGKPWVKVIEEAENNAFFKGSIRFLFQDENGENNWSLFDIKLKNAKLYFNAKPVCPTIELAKYCNDDQIKKIWWNFSFDVKNWKSLLLNSSIYAPIHYFLLDANWTNNSVLYTDIKNILDAIPKQDVWLLQDWNNCNIVLTNYHSKRSEPYNGYVFHVGNRIRNKWSNLVSKITGLIEIHPPQAWGNKKSEIHGQVYYRGLWTNIKYSNGKDDFYFTYYGNNTVCLMTKDWKEKKRKDSIKDDNSGDSYYFVVNDEAIDNFQSHLDCLIARSQTSNTNTSC